MPEGAQGVRVPRALLVALAGVVVAMVALPLLAQPFVPSAATALAVSDKVRIGATGRHAPAVDPARRDDQAAASGDVAVAWINVVALAAERQVGARYADQGDTPATGFSGRNRLSAPALMRFADKNRQSRASEDVG